MAAREIVTLLVIIGGVWLLIQYTGLKAWHAVLVLVAGFYLTLSAAGPQAHQFLSPLPDCSAINSPARTAGRKSEKEKRRTVNIANLFRRQRPGRRTAWRQVTAMRATTAAGRDAR